MRHTTLMAVVLFWGCGWPTPVVQAPCPVCPPAPLPPPCPVCLTCPAPPPPRPCPTCPTCPACPQAEPAAQTPFGSTAPIAGGMRGDIYYLPEGTAQLPDFAGMTPVGSVYTTSLDIPARGFDQGFPGVTDRFEWFAVRYDGSFHAPVAGEYQFRLVSDDGSKLYVDGALVVNDDGMHPPAEARGSVVLQPGTHRITVEYFQGPRLEIALQVFWTPPGQGESIFRTN